MPLSGLVQTFAIETSLIDPLPHQRIAVYRYLLKEPRLRFLLADDAGAGKTIMTGLYIREMLSRRLMRRVLIVPPAGLVGNWRSEMRSLFNLSFRIIGGSEARSKNPFVGPDSDLVIVSVDTLAGDRMFGRLQSADVEPYDLVIFDEAHKLSADREPDLTIRKTNRYQLAEALAGANKDTEDDRWYLPWSCRHLLLLTATPHMGKDYPYYFLWRLLPKADLARAAGLVDYPGFDLLAEYPNGERRAIEVKGRAVVGEVELTENEWVAACNQRDRYWLYVVYNCASSYPQLMRVNDPFMKLVVRDKTSVVVDQRKIFQAAETDD